MAKKKRGRKSKYYEIVYPRLEEISKYIQEGASEKDVIEFLGIASSTFYEYKNKYFIICKYKKKCCTSFSYMIKNISINFLGNKPRINLVSKFYYI